MGRKNNREAWRSVPSVPHRIDYDELDHNRDKRGTGSPEGFTPGHTMRGDGAPSLPEQSGERVSSDAPALDAGEASAKLRARETNPLPSVVHEDDVVQPSGADGDRVQRKLANPRHKVQTAHISGLIQDGHGFLARTQGSVMQRTLHCQQCGGPIPVRIDAENWPCECGTAADDPDREWCKCAGCLGYRQAMESGYSGMGRPPSYCSDRCCKDARNQRRRTTPLPEPEPEIEPEPEEVPVVDREAVDRALAGLTVCEPEPPVQGCELPPGRRAALLSVFVWEASAKRRRMVPMLGGSLDGPPLYRAESHIRDWWPRRKHRQ